ncbi:MAG: hypothetical protein KBS74_03690 [Clostridiales bacterium]|nr:hypothetical protein [Candidatus Cacconaster stercorequi]
MSVSSGVYPVYENQFTIDTSGRAGTTSSKKPIADLETFEVTFDNNVEEWSPMTEQGWKRRLMTGKGVSVKLSGKRNLGDDGNDYVAGLALKSGQDTCSVLDWTFPNGDKLTMPCVVSVTACGTGKSTDVGPLEFECMSDGKPTYTPHTTGSGG